jgi:hypothetical protein
MKKKETTRPATFAEGGGSNKMFRPQAAGPVASGRTGKTQTAAPGAKAASGGPKTQRTASSAVPAKPGRTGAVRGR